jgi:hypothetical protein
LPDFQTVKKYLLLPIIASPVFAAESPLPNKIEFNRDVRPILASACFNCHGFDKATRKADLRLDVRESAVEERDGVRAVVPGKVEDSELWKRLISTDTEEVMPPPKSAHQLTARDKSVLRKWIEQGAEYQAHFAYIPPVKPAVPNVDLGPWKAGNAVDAFVRARHLEIGLSPTPRAGRATLVRRLYFDLLGLPPKSEEVDAFVNDDAPDAYSRLVDKLVASPHFGERMAVWWLDLVRFADTIGYHSDNPKNVWPYRDYVIRAFNENKRFDRFTIEQVAGDLMPDATQETRVASAYNRLILSTEEGGAQPKQYEAKYLVDRVKSIGTTWLAQTLMCAECHDHKFDPVTAKDFYAMGAFFSDIAEPSVGKQEPGMLVPTPEEDAKLAALTKTADELRLKLDGPMPELDEAQAAWERENADGAKDLPWTTARPAAVASEKGSRISLREDGTLKVELEGNPTEDIYRLTVKLPAGTTGIKLEALGSGSLPAGGPGRAGNGNFVVTEFSVEAAKKPLKFSNATATFEQGGFPLKDAVDGKSNPKKGWGVMGNPVKEAAAFFELENSVAAETEVVVVISQIHGTQHTLGKFRISTTSAPKPVRAPNSVFPPDVLAALKTTPEQRKPEQIKRLREHFRTTLPALAPLRESIAKAEKERADFEKSLPRVLVSNNKASRTVRLLPRGDWQNESGPVILPATPGFLPASISSTPEKKLTRLDLAQWLVARENPLTARVFVNRLWKQFYGTGLSKTLEDMGTQSEMPPNQPLLDWLAVEFMDRGWDIKSMVRLLVTSEAYQQSSDAPKDVTARDPENRELARQSRWRVDAEFIRDNALAISGLMNPKLGGPSVKPYQPAGYWENLNFPTREWANDNNENQWRRGLYTWWQRSYVHPAMLAFDAPTREECSADRVRSNIPQQALVLLNDPQFVEAARALALRMQKEGGNTPDARISWAWKLATGRTPTNTETKLLADLLAKHLNEFSNNAKQADSLLAIGYKPTPADFAKQEIAAYTSVARAILNLHETITRF